MELFFSFLWKTITFSSGIEHEILQKSDGIIEGMLLLLLFSRMLRLIYAWQVDKGETIELEGTSFYPRLFLSLSPSGFFSAIWSAQLTKISYMRTKIIIRPQRQKFITYRTVGEIRPIRRIEKVEHRYKTKQVYHHICFYMIHVTVHILRFIISIIIQNENIGL